MIINFRTEGAMGGIAGGINDEMQKIRFVKMKERIIKRNLKLR